ncbi:MAG: phosphatase [Alphaproteobacteria bacterium HGW-Alphaproteobacteria-2]|nr:MAG: phosphatase [Alphaproteobacteria bacterium HGW-Alphaproteobacteria-2]
MICGIIFDKDGTLFDFQATWAVWAERFLLDIADGDGAHAGFLAGVFGFDRAARRFRPESPFVAGTPQDGLAALLAHLPGWNADGLLARAEAHALATPQVEAAPLVPLLAELLARGLRLGVATNDSAEAADAHLRAAGIRGAFDFVAGYDSGHGAKPEPGMLLAFARQTRLAVGSVLMVGDSRHDLAAGRAAGMRTLGVLTGVARAEDLSPLAEAVLPDIAALPGWLADRAAPALADGGRRR